jgi:hypothetical protein
MRLFNKTIDRQLFKQYSLGSDLSKQEVVAKIFNPYGAGLWFILNSDPQDPDYLWAIVDLGYGAEVGSVSRTDLETYRGRFGLGFERDLSFDPVNALELYNGLSEGKYYAKGGGVDDYSDLYGQEVMALKNAKTQAKKTKYDYVVYQNEEGEISFARKNDFDTFFDKDKLDILYSVNSDGLAKNITAKTNPNGNSFDNVFLNYGFTKKRGAYGIRPYENKKFGTYAQIDDKTRSIEIETPDDQYKGGYSLTGVVNFLKSKGFEENGFYADGGEIEVVYERRADFKKKPIKLLLLNKGREQKGYTFSGKDQVAVLDNYNRNKQEDLERLWNLKGYESKYADGGGVNVGYNVFNYTDNIYATDEVFKTKTLANKFIKEFRSRYANQGYYRDNRMNKINIQDIDLLAIPTDFNPFKKYADGGNIADFTDNQQMIMNQNVELEHHHEELEDILKDEMPVPAWVVAKMATATQSISDVTHYLDGEKELMEDEMEDENEEEDEDQDEIENKIVVEPIDVSAGTKTDLTKNFTDEAMGNLRGFLKGMEGVDLRDDYTFDYKDEQYEVEPIINSDENGVSNAVFSIFDGDGEEVGDVSYSRDGGKQKFTANSEFFSWNNAKFEDGGFMNNVYADGGYFDGTIPKASTYMSNYAKGGEVAKAEILGLSKNIMGTTSIEMKISGMRKSQDFSVYPIGKDDTDKIITIQSETRIGKIDLATGRGLMSQSHSNGAYFVHFQMDKLTPFTINESDLQELKMHIFKTAGDNVGSRGIVSDNSGASGVYADGGGLYKLLQYALLEENGNEEYIDNLPKYPEYLDISFNKNGGHKIYKVYETTLNNGKFVKYPTYRIGRDMKPYSKLKYVLKALDKKVYDENFDVENNFAKGGVTYYNEENQYRLGRASGSFEKEIFEKVKDRIHSESFVGNFGWKTPQNKRADGFLYKLDDYDKNVIKNVKLKQGEVVFRYVNRTTAIGGSTPFIKINLEKGLLYFPVFNDNDDIIFETRGVTPLWISLIEGSFAKGGNVSYQNSNYQLLDRLRSDCDYYLGNGNRSEKHLWAGNVDAQIKKMKELWNSFPKDAKPEWLSMNDILTYEKKMKSEYADGGKTDKKFYSLDQIEYDVEYRDKNGEKYSEIFSTKDEALKEIYRLEKLGFVVTSRKRSFKDDGTFNGFFADGGETEDGVDLFEDYENIPDELQEILDEYQDAFEDGDYEGLAKALKEANAIGYTFEYYLDGQAYDLRKIGEKGKSEVEEYAKGGNLKKYILKADIKTVTLKRNGKEVTYNGADVLNGANVLAKGGDISSKANYIPKRDVVEVELKDGSKVKPANGYWVKKGAEPIGAKPTPTTSGKSETKVGETYIRKDARNNWRAETNVENFNGYDWKISTVKTYTGNLVSSAQGGKTEPTGTKGYNIFKYTMYQDPNHTLEVSKPKRLTDKVVKEQHDKALAKFKKFMETGMFKDGGKISNFDKLSAKVAKEYEGKPVKSQYQEEYGRYYSKEEAQEVGDKVAGKVKAMQPAKKEMGGETKKSNSGTETLKKANELAKKIRKDGESWLDAKKRAFAQLKK